LVRRLRRKALKIGELSKTVRLPTMTIRYYETLGLVPPPRRTSSNYRLYGPGDVERLRFIRKAKHLGLSLDEIRGILRLYDKNEPTCLHVRALLDQKLVHIDALLAELQQFRRELVKLKGAAGSLADCRPSGGRICRFIEDIQVGPGPKALALLERGAKAGGAKARRSSRVSTTRRL